MTAPSPIRPRRRPSPGPLAAALALAALAGCGQQQVELDATPPSSAPASVSLLASSTAPLVNGTVTLTATVLTAAGAPVAAGTEVRFEATGGSIAGVTATGPAGQATATLTSAAGGAVTVSATVGTLPAKTLAVTFIDPNAPVAVALVPSTTQADLGTPVALVAMVSPAGAPGVAGAVPDGTTVTFASSAGTLSSITTTAGGVATAVLAAVPAPGDVQVTASVTGAASPPVTIRYADPDRPVRVTVAAAPLAGLIGGRRPVVVTAHVERAGGGPVPAGTPVTFAIAAGQGSLSAGSATTDAAGDASTTVNAAAEGVVTVAAGAGAAPGASLDVAFTDPSRPNAVALFADRPSGVAGLHPVTLTAIVSPADPQEGLVADGTPVLFTVLSGDGLLSASAAATVGGSASVTLDAGSAGTVAVAAQAGASPVVESNTVEVAFVVQPTRVVVTLQTTGTLPGAAAVGGVSALLSASPSAGLSLSAADHAVTGAAAGALLVANPADVALDRIALVHAGGMALGPVVTVTYRVAEGTFPTASDFQVAALGPGVVDLEGRGLATVTVAIQGVAIE
jgi:adhesin/invasin